MSHANALIRLLRPFALMMVVTLTCVAAYAEKPPVGNLDPLQVLDKARGDWYPDLPPETRVSPPAFRSDSILTLEGSTLWTTTLDVEISGSAMFVLCVNGLQIFDVSNIAQPVLVKEIPLGQSNFYSQMTLDGNILYLGRRYQLFIFDVSDAFNPRQLNVLNVGGTVDDIVVRGNRAYVGVGRFDREINDNPMLYILDITDPAVLNVVGTYTPPGQYQECRRIAVVGDYICATNMWDSTVSVISIADETQPSLVKRLTVLMPWDVAYDRGYLYVQEYYYRLKVYDFSVPAEPVFVRSYEGQSLMTMEFRDNKLYGLQQDNGFSLRVYGVSAGAELDSLGYYYTHQPWYGLALRDTIAIVAEGPFGLQVLNTANPASPQLVSAYAPSCYILNGLDVKGNYAYLTNYESMYGYDHTELYTVDISDAHRPFLAHTTPYLWLGNANEVEIRDSMAFVTSFNGHQIAFKITNPLNPVVALDYQTGLGSLYCNATIPNKLFVSSYFHIASYALPYYSLIFPPPQLDDFVDSNTSFIKLDANGGLLYFAGTNETDITGVCGVLDISDPSNLRQLSLLQLNCPTGIGGMTRKDPYLFLASVYGGINIVDISNPAQIKLVGRYSNLELDGQYSNVTYKRNYLFVTTAEALEVFDIAEPTKPELVQYVPMGMVGPGRMVVRDDVLYLAAKLGIYVYHINLPPAVCGDADGSGSLDISDVVYLLQYIFAGGPAPDPVLTGDVDCSGSVDISDVVYLISYIFAGGPAPCTGCQ
jgi:hypothetical protein